MGLADDSTAVEFVVGPVAFVVFATADFVDVVKIVVGEVNFVGAANFAVVVVVAAAIAVVFVAAVVVVVVVVVVVRSAYSGLVV